MKIKLLLSLTISLVLIHGTGAFGKTVDDKEKHKLAGITVTAQKRAENPQDIPMSVDAYSDVFIEDSMMTDTMEMIRFSPNVFMKDSPYENVVVIRGISSFGSSLFSPAAYYVNGVGYTLHYMHDNDLYDIERIEILKGPQGTLYGCNSESGVINIITKQPDNEFRSKILGEYGNYNSYRGNAQVSGPVVLDKLFLGFAAQYKHTDGYFENLHNSDDKAGKQSHFNARGTLRWTPSAPWDISLIADVVNADNKVGVFRYAKGPYTTETYKIRHDEDEKFTEDGNSQVLNIKYQGDAFKVASVTGATYRTFTKLNDADLWDNPANRLNNKYTYKDRRYSEEIRINSTGKGNLQWLGGLYGSYEETNLNIKNMNITRNMVRSHHVTDIDTKGLAAFGQATYTLLQKMHLTFGLRIDNQKSDANYKNRANNLSLNGDISSTELLPKVSLSYDLNEQDMIYATVAKGYLAGSFNWCMNPTRDTFHYDPEYSWNYETGLKTSWLGERLLVNLSLFYITIEDKQVSVVEPETRLNTITNAARAYSYGGEIELKARPVAGLEIFANFGYNQAKFDEFVSTGWNSSYTAVVSEDLAGRHLPFAPDYTYSTGVQYRAENGFMGRVDLFGTGKFYGDAANTSEQKAYQVVNLRLGYEGGNWDAYVWSKNLFDQHYMTWFQPSGSNLYSMDGPPRTIGVTVTYRF